MAAGVREQGWIIAGKRHDGGTPWFTKALGTQTAAYVYWTHEDAEKALMETIDHECYAVFPVEVVILKAPECAACNDSGYADYAAVPCEACGGKTRLSRE